MPFRIPTGTKIYLTKKNPIKLYIQPDTTILNDCLYVAYDLRINGITIIPKGTCVIGDWITESSPTIAAQLQLNTIYINGLEQPISADSDVYENLSAFNTDEINNSLYLYKIMDFRSPANIIRRIVKTTCQIQILYDNALNKYYIEIPTDEIPLTITSDISIN